MSELAAPAKPRRNIEAVLLVLALAVGVGANMLVGIDEDRAFDSDFWVQGGTLVALVLAFHVVLRFRAKYADPVILPVVTALNGIGLAMIHRIDIAEGTAAADRQLLWSALAVAVAIGVLFLIKDHRILRRYTYISLIVSAVLLLLPLTPLGLTINGARIWISVGGGTFQQVKSPRSLWPYSLRGICPPTVT